MVANRARERGVLTLGEHVVPETLHPVERDLVPGGVAEVVVLQDGSQGPIALGNRCRDAREVAQRHAVRRFGHGAPLAAWIIAGWSRTELGSVACSRLASTSSPRRFIQ